MKKNLYMGLRVVAVCFVMISGLFAASKKVSDESVSAGGNVSFWSLAEEALRQKARLAIEMVAALGTQGKTINLKAMGAELLRVQKYVLSDISNLESISIGGGILVLSPGGENSVSYLATPEQKKRVTCKTIGRSGIQLGFADGAKRDASERLIVFVVTYVAGGKVPRIVASGDSQVFVRPIDKGDICDIQLSDRARCAAQELRVDDLSVKLTGESSFSAASVVSRLFNIATENKAQINVIGAQVSGLTRVIAKGATSERYSRVRLQGSTAKLEAHVLGGELDSSFCQTPSAEIHTTKDARAIVAHVTGNLDVFKKPSRGTNPELVIEVIGNPKIRNSSEVGVKIVKDVSSLVSRLGSGEGLLSNSGKFIQDITRLVGEAMRLAASFADVLAR